MKKRSITETQQAFVAALVSGSSTAEAAREVGYPVSVARSKMRIAAVNLGLCSYARKLTRGFIDLEGAPQGYKLLMDLMQDKTTPKSIRVDIAKFLVNHSVPAPKAFDAEGERELDPAEMTNDELQAFIRKSDSEMVERGLMIDATPKQTIDSVV